MTTGNSILDTSYPVVWYDNGDYAGSTGNIVGRRLTRSWSGADAGIESLRLPQATTKHWSADLPDGRAAVVTKRYRPRSAALEPHSYTMVAVNASMRATSFSLIGDYGGTRTFTNITPHRMFGGFPPNITWPAWTANDDIKLINQLKGKTRGAEFNLGTFLGEGREALTMIGDAAIRIARSLSYVRVGNLVAAANVLSEAASVQTSWRARNRKFPPAFKVRRKAVDQVSSNWLELAWGWYPMVEDIRSAAEFLAHKLNVPFVQRVVARRTIGYRLTGSGYSWGSRGVSVQKQIVAYFSEPESIPKQLGLLDPAVVAWELTPLSALMDYVIPIGGWLEARGFAQGLTGKFITTVTSRLEVENLILGKTFERIPGYPAHYVGNDLGVFYKSTQMDRSISTSLQIPLPRVKPLNEIASFRHCINALAVLSQVLQGKVSTIPRGG